MLVICCGMMRSGSTLQYNLALELVRAFGVGDAGGMLAQPSTLPALAAQYPGAQMCILKAHVWPEELAEARARAPVRLIYCYRDLRDVLA